MEGTDGCWLVPGLCADLRSLIVLLKSHAYCSDRPLFGISLRVIPYQATGEVPCPSTSSTVSEARGEARVIDGQADYCGMRHPKLSMTFCDIY